MPDPTNLVEQLSQPGAYSQPVAHVEHLQTHISHIFFVGDTVYKLKKAVNLGFLDFTTLEKRRHFCAEEVRLNQRLAKDVYRGVVAVYRAPDGSLHVGGSAGHDDDDHGVVDYAVEMRRLPADCMLDHHLDAGVVDNDMMRRLARILVDFHRDAARGAGIDQHGSPAAIRANCDENFEQTRAFTRGPLWTISVKLHEFLRRRAARFLEQHQPLLARRVASGRIRDGHGDLHAGNICMMPDQTVIYDCIEFAARFRCGDVANDLAFLLMDLDLRCFRGFSDYLLHHYVELGGDTECRELMTFYKGYRAFVRGKVTSMALEATPAAPADTIAPREQPAEQTRTTAMAYFHLAAAYELPPALILCCGLPGCGKSYAARHLARPFEAAVLNSDATRKRQAGRTASATMTAAVDSGIYTAERSAATYADLLERARELIARGRTVILDAGFRHAAQRRGFVEWARTNGTPLVVLHFDTDESTILDRLGRRGDGPDSGSDAKADVYRALAARFEAPFEIPDSQRLTHDGVSPMDELTSALIDRLIS